MSTILKTLTSSRFLLILANTITIYLLLCRQDTLQTEQSPPPTATTAVASASTTSVRNLLFSIASSSKSFPNRKPYIRLWYNPQTTRAFIFLDRPPNVSAPTLPPVIISADTSRFPYTFPRGLRSAVRVARIVKDVVDREPSEVRWFVFGDDDTVFFVDNLVTVLSNYDHESWVYVGGRSESYEQNVANSFDMAFGGGGFAISSSLARVLARVSDSCLMRYGHLYGSDSRVFSCLAELGIGLTHEPGFHQVDLRGNLFGMLSAHPLSPLLSLHHLDAVDPLFPNMNRTQALTHLFKAAKVDPARVLQKTVCYDRTNSLTVSISWGYAVQIYDGNQLLPDLLPLQRTFVPWRRRRSINGSFYMFNTRDYPKDPCERPTIFFFQQYYIKCRCGRQQIQKAHCRELLQA